MNILFTDNQIDKSFGTIRTLFNAMTNPELKYLEIKRNCCIYNKLLNTVLES